MLLRQITAFRRAMVTLAEYYSTLFSGSLPTPIPNPTFPYPTSYTPAGSSGPRSFKYTESVPGQLHFFGRSDTDERLCIKFTRYYSKEVHEFCAKEGFAPSLHAMECLPDGWYMVVMDDVRVDYVDLATFLRNVTELARFRSILDNIRRRLVKLHQAGLAHGDIRDATIFASNTGLNDNFLLVDFTTSGEIGKAVYPLFVNRIMVTRPEEVRDNQLVLAEHDMHMLDILDSSYELRMRCENV